MGQAHDDESQGDGLRSGDAMMKLHPDGTVRKYGGQFEEGDWTVSPAELVEPPSVEPNLSCECGSDQFKVCWWDYPNCGGYCRVVCAACEKDLVLINDYA